MNARDVASAESFGRIEKDLQEERAAALRRIAEGLEERLRRLAGLHAQLALTRAESRSRLMAEHARLREEARLWRWYLVVQREAVGFSRHDDLERFYPLPPSLDAS